MKILGISAFYHDSAAAILVDGKIIAAAQEERFTRIKHDAAFPVNAVKFCLRQAGLSIDDVDAIAFYDKPLLKFERLLETYYGFAPKGLFSFIKSMPIWIKEKLFLKRIIREELEKIEPFDKKKLSFYSRNITCRILLAHFSLHPLKRLPFLPLMVLANGQRHP
jgi:carbamoyltransferase